MFDNLTPEQIKAEIMADTVARYPGLSTVEGGFLDAMVAPIATKLWKAYQSLNAIVPIAHVDESSGGYIDLRCEEFGVAPRKDGLRATMEVTLEGKAGTAVPKGVAFLTAEGLPFELDADVILGADGNGLGTATAAAPGAVYNVDAGALVRMYVNVAGLERFSGGAAAGGADPETDGALVGRLYDRLQRPATSGNAYHYEQWAKEVTGIGAAKVLPLWAGPGTVKVMVVGPQKEPVSEETVAACAAHIEALRPVGPQVSVVSAVGLVINVEATVRTDGTVTPETVQGIFAASVDAYLKDVAFRQYTVLYNRVAFLLLDIDGVEDYETLTVNGGEGNVAVEADQVPVPGTVVVR